MYDDSRIRTKEKRKGVEIMYHNSGIKTIMYKNNRTRTSKNQILKVIDVERYLGLYVVIDKRTDDILAEIAVEDSASDFINSRLRDDIIKLCYQYGKELGNY